MNLRVKTTITNPRLASALEGLDGSGKRRILNALAREFANITRKNFGPSGLSRPSNWKRLREKYARWKKRRGGSGIADLISTGKLQKSIRYEANNDSFSEVHVGEGCPYAEAHQEGRGRMPYRPFIPIDRSGKPTPFVQKVLRDTAEREIEKIIHGKT